MEGKSIKKMMKFEAIKDFKDSNLTLLVLANSVDAERKYKLKGLFDQLYF